jgi:hypothetical protein
VKRLARRCAARDLDHAAQHGAQRHQDGHRAQGAAHTGDQRGNDVAGGNACDHGHEQADQHERHEGMHLEADDEKQKQGNAGGSNAE